MADADAERCPARVRPRSVVVLADNLPSEGSPYDFRIVDRHPDGSLRIQLMDGNSVRLSAGADGRTRLSIFGPGGGHHATIRLTENELHDVIAALATSAGIGGASHAYRDAMTP
jgi:hypothetical protein